MKKIQSLLWTLAAALTFTVSGVSAQAVAPQKETTTTSQTKSSLTATPTAQKKRSLMWKITGKNNTAYLLGSVHLATKAFYPMPTEIENAFAQSSILAVEINLNKVNPAQAMQFIQSSAVYAGDDTIWKHLSPETAEKLRKFGTEHNLPIETFAKLKPWVVALMASVIPLQKNGFNPDLGIDKYFLDKDGENKRIAEIESADWQVRLLSSQPDDQQEKFLSSVLVQAADIRKFGDMLQNVWLQGDTAQLEAAFAEMNATAPEFSKKLLDDRNPKMADFAENCVKGTDRCFVVVGAAHLIGKKGVVQLLKDRGYQVEQVLVTAPK